jgi:hypothetical protein
MGDWQITIDGGPSGHGCDRRSVEGETLQSCGRSDCPDCVAVEVIANLARRGVPVKKATVTHWPGTPQTVVDEYRPGTLTGTVTGTRVSGNFRPKSA